MDHDAVETDNSRFAVVDLPAEVPVLLVDGDEAATDARYLNMLLASGGQATAGIKPTIEMPAYLGAKPLGQFQAITLANVDRLDPSAVRALERYVRDGGGVAFFLGERTDSRFINEMLYRGGKGLFPLPLALPADLLVDRLEIAPDVEVEDVHNFIFHGLTDDRNSYLNMVLVEKYFAAAPNWQPKKGSPVSVIAKLRNGAPLVVKRDFGKGRVVAFLTTASPTWNNWAKNPSVVAMLDLQAYLIGRPADVARRVGEPLQVPFSVADYQKQVRFATPMEEAVPPVDAVLGPNGQWLATLSATDRSGFYEARLTNKTTGKTESRRFAVNVDAAEGDLQAIDGPDLAARLQREPAVKYQFAQVETFEAAVGEQAGYNLKDTLLYLLIALLIGEQVLAWSASYHPPAAAAAAVTVARQPSFAGGAS